MLSHLRPHGRVPISQEADRLRGQCGQELLLFFVFCFLFFVSLWKEDMKQNNQGQQVWEGLASLISVGSGK